jgi:hypothetical protein
MLSVATPSVPKSEATLKGHELLASRENVMGLQKIVALCVFAGLPSMLGGCSICCSPYLDDYAAYGSRIPRLDMKHGRVGSVFSDPQLVGRPASSSSTEIYEGMPGSDEGLEIVEEVTPIVYEEEASTDG